MKRPIHYAPDQPVDGLREVSVCGIGREAGMFFAASPEIVTCRRACRKTAAAEVARLEQLRLRAVGATILFLDFDGVLNHVDFFIARSAAREREDGPKGSFDLACVARLNRLVAASGALVVVSSSWRLGSTVQRLQTLLEGYGFQGTIIGMTPDRCMAPEGSSLLLAGQRGDEIKAWIEALPAPPRASVVLDDDNDMDAVRERFVRTDFRGGGLTDEKVEEALQVLAGAGRRAA